MTDSKSNLTKPESIEARATRAALNTIKVAVPPQQWKPGYPAGLTVDNVEAWVKGPAWSAKVIGALTLAVFNWAKALIERETENKAYADDLASLGKENAHNVVLLNEAKQAVRELTAERDDLKASVRALRLQLINIQGLTGRGGWG